MKLISLVVILVCLSMDIWAQHFDDEPFPFLPHFQTSSSNDFASDSSLYLPLEHHTAVPYFGAKNGKLPFQYLPPTGTKAPASFPTPFPIMMSSSFAPNFDDDDDDRNNQNSNQNKRQPTSPRPTPPQNKINGTQRVNSQSEFRPEKREMRPIPKNLNYEQPIDRVDLKFPANMAMNVGVTSQPQMSQTPASRRMIISPETMRSDQGLDLIKSGTFAGPHYVQAPGVFISSTTEPAIPILRLSNEMDLDGSFSYEALGADQTHYVQHSHMENMGTEKEEQVVEGSYSYVGDNGQTYTVHYIADSNGFRASGEHLPVAPPIPEIIQRAVQYNLAEEAKRPAHLKSWQDDDKSNDVYDSDKINKFPVAPSRSLFTGRTPEAFSFNYGQGVPPQNNMVAAASSQTPIKTAMEFPKEQTQAKPNNGPISPQVTFLASQGAHVPSMNTAQQSIARMFTTEKSNMPQLMNYEAANKDADQESNKALWRWQYGINANTLNQNTNKNTISRSSGDEVMINFSKMTPEQYTSMIQSQLVPNNKENIQAVNYEESKVNINSNNHYYNSYSDNHHNQNTTENKNIQFAQDNKDSNQNYNLNNIQNYQYQEMNQRNINDNNNFNYQKFLNQPTQPSPITERSINQPTEEHQDLYRANVLHAQHETEIKEDRATMQPNQRANLLTHHSFVPPSLTVTKSYDYEDDFYESRKIIDINKKAKAAFLQPPLYDNYREQRHKNEDVDIKTTTPTTTPLIVSDEKSIKFEDFIVQENNKFKPIITSTEIITEEHTEKPVTTTENVEELLTNNIFLKNLVRPNKPENNSNNKITDYVKMQFHPKIIAEPKTEKKSKFIQHQPKPINEVKEYRQKTMDLSEMLNYVSQKNHFESNKMKPKNKYINFENVEQTKQIPFVPSQVDKHEQFQESEDQQNNFRTLNHQQQEELRGIIKNYKVLQRNNNNIRNEQEKMNQLRRDLSPPPVRMLHSPNLPPLGRAGPSMKSYLPPIFV